MAMPASITAIEIPTIHYKAMCEHVLSQPEHEVCGLLGGEIRTGTAIVSRIVATRNSSPQPAIAYTVAPEDFIAAFYAFEKDGLALVGVYHSHPQGSATPSLTDRAEATLPHAVYVILAYDKENLIIRAWNFHEGRAKLIPLRRV